MWAARDTEEMFGWAAWKEKGKWAEPAYFCGEKRKMPVAHLKKRNTFLFSNPFQIHKPKWIQIKFEFWMTSTRFNKI
jgi:hypothetical protein